MTPFAEFKKKEKKSDKIMMAIYLAYDAKSDFVRSGMDHAQILNDVSINYLEDKNFDWSKYENIIEAYKDICTSRVHKKLNEVFAEIESITSAMVTLAWDDEGEARQKEFLMTTSKKLFTEFIQLQKDLDEEIAELLYEGDYAPSWLEEQSL
jgi:hypothetical protein